MISSIYIGIPYWLLPIDDRLPGCLGFLFAGRESGSAETSCRAECADSATESAAAAAELFTSARHLTTKKHH